MYYKVLNNFVARFKAYASAVARRFSSKMSLLDQELFANCLQMKK
jgi:hypothetical protein